MKYVHVGNLGFTDILLHNYQFLCKNIRAQQWRLNGKRHGHETSPKITSPYVSSPYDTTPYGTSLLLHVHLRFIPEVRDSFHP